MAPLDLPDEEKKELLETAIGTLDRLVDYYTNFQFNRDEVMDYLFKLGGSHQLRLGPERFDLYFNDAPEVVFENFRVLILNFLNSIRTFIFDNQEQIDKEVLRKFNNTGIASHTVDIRRFPTMELIEKAKSEGEQADFQTARDLNTSLQSFTQETINLKYLIETFEGNPANVAILFGLFVVSDPGEDLFSNEALTASYNRFKHMLEQLGLAGKDEQSIVTSLTEYTLALHLFSDAVTNRDDRLRDTLSNVFVRLEYGLMALSIYLQTGDSL